MCLKPKCNAMKPKKVLSEKERGEEGLVRESIARNRGKRILPREDESFDLRELWRGEDISKQDGEKTHSK